MLIICGGGEWQKKLVGAAKKFLGSSPKNWGGGEVAKKLGAAIIFLGSKIFGLVKILEVWQNSFGGGSKKF